MYVTVLVPIVATEGVNTPAVDVPAAATHVPPVGVTDSVRADALLQSGPTEVMVGVTGVVTTTVDTDVALQEGADVINAVAV